MREGAARGRAARLSVATQLAVHVVAADLTGSPEFVALRIRHFAEAARSGDPHVQRAACMDLAGAAAAYCAQVDLDLPVLEERPWVPLGEAPGKPRENGTHRTFRVETKVSQPKALPPPPIVVVNLVDNGNGNTG